MNKISILVFILCSFLMVNAESSPPKTDKVQKTTGKIKIGNKTGTLSVTLDLGIIKFTRTTIQCDGDPDRKCYEKRGEDICSAAPQFVGCAIYEYGDGTGFGGVQVGDETVIDHADGSSQTVVNMIFDSYYTF